MINFDLRYIGVERIGHSLSFAKRISLIEKIKSEDFIIKSPSFDPDSVYIFPKEKDFLVVGYISYNFIEKGEIVSSDTSHIELWNLHKEEAKTYCEKLRELYNSIK